jgi:hypothetical protein
MTSNNMDLYVPLRYCNTENPLVFLAGPIQGASRWQNEATNLLKSYSIGVASPRYIGENEGSIGDWAPKITFQKQIDWETFHLNKAGQNGVILFWLSKEDQHFCNRAFAQTSRFELGEWKQRHLSENSRLVVGIDEGFSGGGYIEYRLSQQCPNIPIEKNLTDACKRVLDFL